MIFFSKLLTLLFCFVFPLSFSNAKGVNNMGYIKHDSLDNYIRNNNLFINFNKKLFLERLKVIGYNFDPFKNEYPGSDFYFNIAFKGSDEDKEIGYFVISTTDTTSNFNNNFREKIDKLLMLFNVKPLGDAEAKDFLGKVSSNHNVKINHQGLVLHYMGSEKLRDIFSNKKNDDEFINYKIYIYSEN